MNLSYFRARFPHLLDEAIVEEGGDGRKAETILSWDSLEMEVARQVLRFVYCGAFDLGAIKTAKQLEACKGLNTNAIIFFAFIGEDIINLLQSLERLLRLCLVQ